MDKCNVCGMFDTCPCHHRQDDELCDFWFELDMKKMYNEGRMDMYRIIVNIYNKNPDITMPDLIARLDEILKIGDR